MAKLLKLRRGTTSQHASFTGAEGEVTIDTTKDTAVVHDGSTAGGKPLAKEDMTNVSSAAIAGQLGTSSIANSKLADSGVSAGTVGSSTAIPIVTVNSKGIVTATSTSAVDSTTIQNGSSVVAVSTDGPITSNANHDFSAGIDVTGNITVSGTVDGRDVAADGTKLDGIESSATADQTAAEIRTLVESASDSNVFTDADHTKLNGIETSATADQTADEIKTLVGNASDSNVFTDADHAKLDALTTSNGVILNGVTATTQSAGDASTKVATTAYTDTAVSNLVDSSPGALNTLNELAAAIGDDANFSTTITNSIAGKLATNGNGSSVTNLNASALASGTIPDARFPSTLPAVNGANLTGIVSFVSGMIILWSGNTGNIPSGWVLCNGSNSTPDLRNRFVIGAGSSYNPGNTGGATTDSISMSISGSDTVSLSGTFESDGNVYYHTTGQYRGYYSTVQNRYYSSSDQGTTIRVRTAVNFSDTVNISGSGSATVDTVPPYYALCYIMKT